MQTVITLFSLFLTIIAYIVSKRIASKYPNPFTTPVFLGTAFIILIYVVTDLSYEDYIPTKEMITFFLGPATVALAIPLYKNYKTLITHWLPAFIGVVVGTTTAIFTAIGLSYLFSYGRDMILAMSAKSVTVPIAIEIVNLYDGDPALVAAFVVATGTAGVMLGPWLMDKLRIYDPMARGIAMGTISHGQGTAAAMREGSVQGAMAGVAMGIAAIITSFLAPAILSLFLN